MHTLSWPVFVTLLGLAPVPAAASDTWAQSGNLRIRRMQPVLTARGKLLPLYVPKRHGRTALLAGRLAIGMFGFGFSLAPFYSQICAALGIQVADRAEADALAWLDRVRPGVEWNEALRLAGYAPLAAIDVNEHLDTHAAMQRDFSAVARGSASPLEVAARWSKLEPPFVLNWLARQVQP